MSTTHIVFQAMQFGLHRWHGYTFGYVRKRQSEKSIE